MDGILLLHGFILGMIALACWLFHLRVRHGLMFDAVSVSWMGYVIFVAGAVAGASTYGPFRPNREIASYTIFIIYLGTFAYFLGLLIRPGYRAMARLIPTPHDVLTKAMAWFLWFLLIFIWGSGYLLLQFMPYGFRNISFMMVMGGVGGSAAIAIYILTAVRGSFLSKFFMALHLGFVLFFLVNVAFSRRFAPGILLGLFLFFYHVRMRHSSIQKRAMSITIALLVGVLAVALLSAYRQKRVWGAEMRSLADKDLWIGMVSGTAVQYIVLEFTVANYPDNYAYLNGSGIVPLLTFPVLRAVWPNKPLPSGSVISRRYLGNKAVDEYNASVFNTIIGEFYMNFGPMGVPLCMFLVGIFISAVNHVLITHVDNMTLMVAWLVLIPHWMTEWRGDLNSTTVMALAVVSMLLGLSWLLGKVYRPASKTAWDAEMPPELLNQT